MCVSIQDIITVTFAFIDFSLFILGVVGNAIVIYVISSDRKLKNKSNYHILSVAVADFLIALPGIPLSVIAGITGYPHDHQQCLLLNSFLLAVFAASHFSLVAVSIDRYWAVCDPVTYHVRTERVTKLIILMCWIMGIIVGFMLSFGWNSGNSAYRCDLRTIVDFNYLYFVCFAIAFPSTLIILVLYFLIYRAILKQTQTRQEMVVYTTELLKRKKEIRATHTLALVVGSFIVLWTPGIIILIVLATTQNRELDLDYLKFSTILVHLNSMLDPIIYAWRMRSIRIAFLKLCPIPCLKKYNMEPNASIASRRTMQTSLRVSVVGQNSLDNKPNMVEQDQSIRL